MSCSMLFFSFFCPVAVVFTYLEQTDTTGELTCLVGNCRTLLTNAEEEVIEAANVEQIKPVEAWFASHKKSSGMK